MKRALLLLGGSWHDFDGFAKWFSDLLNPRGWEVETTFDLNRLLQLEQEDYDLVASYTCFSDNPDPENQQGSGKMELEQVVALTNWVRKGGTFYAVHGASVLGETNPIYADLVGGKFIKHPPAFEFKVYPMFDSHEITEGIGPFTVHEELYLTQYDGENDILLVSLLDDIVHPLVWCRYEGLGRVVYNSLGHVPETWRLPEYEKLTLQSIDWLLDWVK